MDHPRRASDMPFPVELEQGKAYFWCACGLSASQPFCDGSHQGTGFSPQRYDATESKRVFFCGCKRSEGPPLCDGSHGLG